jgi:hypothetical protein
MVSKRKKKISPSIVPLLNVRSLVPNRLEWLLPPWRFKTKR